MITEDFHGRFSVRVEGRLELELLDANFFIKSLQNTNEMAETNVSISNETFALMEFSKMGGVKRLVSEYSVDREVLHGFEF